MRGRAIAALAWAQARLRVPAVVATGTDVSYQCNSSRYFWLGPLALARFLVARLKFALGFSSSACSSLAQTI